MGEDRLGIILNNFSDNSKVKIYGSEADEYIKNYDSAAVKMEAAKKNDTDCSLTFPESFALFGIYCQDKDKIP